MLSLTTLLALLIATVAAAAPLPKRPTTGNLSGGAPPSGDGEAAVSTTSPLRSLSVGESGAQVMALQRKLREKGARVSVDGDFGPATRAAVRALQRKLGMKATGIASVSFLRKLGLRTLPGVAVTVAGSPSAAPTGSGVYLKAFPVGGDGYSYSNDFGAPRHQGAHEGNDIICTEEPTPILSATYGQIQRLTRVETGLGGIWIWIVDPQGNEYYYAHLSEISAGLQEGSEVWPGRVIGECGNTGDARYGVQHLHFEVHPGGGAATNPYTDLRAVDPQLKRGARATSRKRAASVPAIRGL